MRLTRTAAAALIIALVVILGFVPHPPAAEGAAISSVRSGRWSEPATWSCACVPGPGDSVTVGLGHVVGLIGDNEAFSVRIEAGGKLVVSRLSASSLTLRNNLIVEGTLDLGTDASPVTMPVLVKWTGINEAAFVGGD
ncbi:MAG: G8 domain-containing protein, partial [Anaerolineales bacterium]